MSSEHPDDIVRLTMAPNAMQAHIWEQALKDEGIRCKVVGDFLEAGLGDIASLRAEIWVHQDDVSRAEAILKRMTEGSDDDE